MTLRHLRTNAVGYLALAVALGTGTAYAADQIANGSVTTKKLANDAVTAPKIKKNAVRSSHVKDRSLLAKDLAAGVVPAAGDVVVSSATDPVATPDVASEPAFSLAFSFDRPGRVWLRFFASALGVTCDDGARRVGLYLDGVPVPGTQRGAPDSGDGQAVELTAVVPVAAGAHTASVGLDCPDGDSLGFTNVRPTWTAALIAE
jgi:hypothetical protein